MRKPIDTLAGGLGHPEGPDVLPDGRIVMVETYTSTLIAWARDRGIHDHADCGGGPNACMLGSDGAVYITQNGGTDHLVTDGGAQGTSDELHAGGVLWRIPVGVAGMPLFSGAIR